MVLTKSSVNLIHDVKRCGLVMVQRKDQGEAGECLLAAAQVSNVFPALLRWPDAKNYALQWYVRNPMLSSPIY